MKPCLAVSCVVAAASLGYGGALMADSGPSGGDPDRLRSENLRLRQENRVAQVELDRLRQVIAGLEAELAAARRQLAQRTPGPEPPPPAGPEPPAGGEPIPAVAAVEEEDLSDEELGELLAESTPPPPVAPPPVAPAAPSPPAASPESEVSSEARILYDDSYTLFHEHRYQEAEAGFRRFLELHPSTELADNAQFWIGECRYARSEFEVALQAFMLTVERYPDGNKVPDALYKAGRCLESMGDRERATATYEEVGRRFPSSSAAIAARERLADLR